MPLTQDPTLVTSSRISQVYTAGATLTRGMPFYLDASDELKGKPATNAGALELATAKGIVLQDVATGQPFLGSVNGADVNLGVAAALGEDYYVGVSGGVIASTEFIGGEQVTHLGTGQADGSIKQNIVVTGGTY